MGKSKKTLTFSEVIRAIYLGRGIQGTIAEILGVRRQTVANYVRRYPEIKAAYEDAQEATVDFVESKLLENIEHGQERSIIFYLKTKGKARGYVERQEVTGADGTPLNQKIYSVVSPDDWDEAPEA